MSSSTMYRILVRVFSSNSTNESTLNSLFRLDVSERVWGRGFYIPTLVNLSVMWWRNVGIQRETQKESKGSKIFVWKGGLYLNPKRIQEDGVGGSKFVKLGGSKTLKSGESESSRLIKQEIRSKQLMASIIRLSSSKLIWKNSILATAEEE